MMMMIIMMMMQDDDDWRGWGVGGPYGERDGGGGASCLIFYKEKKLCHVGSITIVSHK